MKMRMVQSFFFEDGCFEEAFFEISCRDARNKEVYGLMDEDTRPRRWRYSPSEGRAGFFSTFSSIMA
jgi:hypothetical protein